MLAHLLNCPVEHLLIRFLTGNVENLVESVHKCDGGRLLVESGDLQNVINSVSVKTAKICQNKLIFLTGLHFADCERSSALRRTDGKELIETVVRQHYTVVGVEFNRNSHKSLRSTVTHVVNRKIARVSAKLFGVDLKRSCTHAEHPQAVGPYSRNNGSVKALFKFTAKLLSAFGQRLYALFKLCSDFGRALNAVIDDSFFNVITEHLPVVLKVSHHALKNGDDYGAQIADAGVGESKTQFKVLHVHLFRFLREHYFRRRCYKESDNRLEIHHRDAGEATSCFAAGKSVAGDFHCEQTLLRGETHAVLVEPLDRTADRCGKAEALAVPERSGRERNQLGFADAA